MVNFAKPGHMYDEELGFESDVAVVDECFVDNLEELARGYLRDFFQGKQLYCGGKISSALCMSKHFVDLVLNTTVEQGVDLAYKILGRTNISLVLKIFEECGNLGIPKWFRPGILLAYLELCHGHQSHEE